MPACYTHYKFGETVLMQLPASPTKEILEKNKDLFLIGLHGPDILFYYKALQKDNINQLGHRMHFIPARPFFEKALAQFPTEADPDAALAYMCGFVCHLALDFSCHSCVEYYLRGTTLSHTEVETYLDRSYLLEDQRDPLTWNISNHVQVNGHTAEVIASLFHGLDEVSVSTKQMLRTLKEMKWYNQIFLPTSPLKEKIVRLGMKLVGKYEHLHGLIMKRDCDEATQAMVDHLRRHVQDAVPVTIQMIEHFISCHETGQSLDERFDNHYSFTEEKIAECAKEIET